jgi:hypothetical protein
MTEFTHSVESISLADWLQLATFLFALALFALDVRRRRIEDAKSLRTQRIEIYQRLEIESNSVFKFEAENKDVLPEFKTHLGPPASAFLKRADEDDDRLVARKYYENCCNLFEVAARLRAAEVIDPPVFGSWLAWYFDTLVEWGFRALWADLRDNYTPDLRAFFDPFVERLVASWDIPHEKAAAAGDTARDVPPAELDRVRAAFYRHVGDLLDCDIVRTWLETVETGRPASVHPLAYC